MASKWIICGECKHFDACKAGQARMYNVDIDSKAYKEIGCFEYEQYISQLQGKQLKLF